MTKQVTLRIMVLTATSFMCNHDVRKQTNMFLLLINFLNWKYLSMEYVLCFNVFNSGASKDNCD